MKNCAKCGPQNESCFSKKTSSKDGLQSICKKCMREVRIIHYSKNKNKIKKRSRINNRRYKKRNSQFIWDYLKQNPCVDCGETDPIVLEFDHRGDKEYDVSKLVSCALNKIIKEIAKCDVRCANCHKRKTAKQFNYYKNIQL